MALGSSGALDLGYTRNGVGAVEAVNDNAATGRGATFAYTGAGRLSSAAGSWGAHAYGWDAAGNRTGGAGDQAVLATAGNRVEAVNGPDGALKRDLVWTAGGNLWKDLRPAGPSYEYGRNKRGRLTTVTADGVVRAAYGYDYAGRRV